MLDEYEEEEHAFAVCPKCGSDHIAVLMWCYQQHEDLPDSLYWEVQDGESFAYTEDSVYCYSCRTMSNKFNWVTKKFNEE
jgi:hypothetical protein